MKLSRSLLAVTSVVAAIGLASCGDDDGDSIADLLIVATDSEDGARLEMPSSVPAGVTRIEVENSGERDHDAQLIRVEGEHSADEVYRAIRSSGRGLPDWLTFGGGAPPAERGETASAVQVLEPGSYVAFDTESFDQSSLAEFEVTGEADGDLPATDATISAFDYGFEADGLEAGAGEIFFENTGDEPHHMRAAPLREGATMEDVREFIENEEGRPPVDLSRGVSTAVLEGGTSQVVELELDAGAYAMLCFIADRAGGPPHIAKGMIAGADVAG